MLVLEEQLSEGKFAPIAEAGEEEFDHGVGCFL